MPRLLEPVEVERARPQADDPRPRPARCAGCCAAWSPSGSGIGLADVPGPEVIAKTGTAEFQGDDGIETHAWMIAAQGDLAVAVFVEVGPVRLEHRRPDPGGSSCALRAEAH